MKPDSRFPQTSWELLTQVSARADAGTPALNEFTERYYGAVRAYVAAIVRDAGEYEDLTQRFFVTVVLSGRLFAGADRQKGTFRPYLKQAIRNFLVDEHRRRQRKKRQADGPDVHLDGVIGGWEKVAEKPSTRPDLAFQKAWGQSVVRVALSQVERICEERGQRAHFEIFVGRFLSDDAEPRSWRDLGAPFTLDEKTARSRADTVIRRFRRVLRALVAVDVEASDKVDAEIQSLMSVF